MGYGIGTRMARAMHLYWDHHLMMARAGKYYGVPFQGTHGVTHGDPIYPIILNMVVDAVIWNWVTIVAGEEAEPEGFG